VVVHPTKKGKITVKSQFSPLCSSAAKDYYENDLTQFGLCLFGLPVQVTRYA
jgi:hypothetical protein